MFIRLPLLVAALLAAPAAMALQHREYDPVQHDRFVNFPADPAPNPGFIWGHLDLTGVGWDAADLVRQYTLVSRQHVIFATHFVPSLPRTVRFLAADGNVVSATVVSQQVIPDPATGEPSDLTLMTLAEPLDDSRGVQPLPYLDLASGSDYEGLSLGTVGKSLRGGRARVYRVDSGPREVSSSSVNPSRFLRFDYPMVIFDGSDSYLEVGDSGSPSFVPTAGRAAVVGLHSFIENGMWTGDRENYDVFVPHYVSELDEALGPLGYRMRPANAPATTLTGSVAAAGATPRRAKPLTVEFTISNLGPATGNVEVEYEFPAGQAPDGFWAPGWIISGDSNRGTLRRATFDGGSSVTLSSHWNRAPDVEVLAPTLVWRSDSSPESSLSPVIDLAPSYAAWAAGLGAAEVTDDPDGDGLENLLEYAFGGDPESGRLVFADGTPITPAGSLEADMIEIRHPERDDAAERGLEYRLWFSSGLESWSVDPPAGLTSEIEAFDPPRPGLVQRVVRWSKSDPKRFVRVEVSLDE